MKTVATLMIAVLLLSACTVVPKSAVRRDAQDIKKLTDFELCRAYLSFDLTNRALEQSAIPSELKSRDLTGRECFEILVADQGVDEFCEAHNQAVSRGEPAAKVGFAMDIPRSIMEEGLNALGINCYTDDYIARSAKREAASSRNADRVKDVFDSLEESIKNQNTTTTRCRKTTYDTVECRESTY